MDEVAEENKEGGGDLDSHLSVEDYVEDDEDIRRYNIISKVSLSNGLLAVYVYTSILAITIAYVAFSVTEIQSGYFGVENFTTYATFGISALSSAWIVHTFSKKEEEFGFTQNDVAYHYLASAALAYQQSEDDYGEVEKHLKKFKNYCGRSKRVVLFPESKKN